MRPRRLYTASLNFGVSAGIIIAGVITINHDWRMIYYVASGLIGALTLLVILTMPETSYNRGGIGEVELGSSRPKKKSYLASLKLFQGTLTNESLWKIGLRPVVMLALPPVLWVSNVDPLNPT